MKDKLFGVLQRVGRSFMLPIAILPVAGLLLGIGGSFTNQITLETYGLMGIMGPGTVATFVEEDYQIVLPDTIRKMKKTEFRFNLNNQS